MRKARDFRRLFCPLVLFVVFGASHGAAGQAIDDAAPPITPVLKQRIVPLDLDSGLVHNAGARREVVFENVVTVAGADWIRLKLSGIVLSGSPHRADGAVIRVTSLLDGAVQTLDAVTAAQWENTTAYFNGDSVRVELVADPGAGLNRLRFDFAWVGRNDREQISQCGPTDDRTLSDDPRSARVLPIGCTAFIIDDDNHCFLTAGHCAGGSGLQVVEFNVPLSDVEGNLRHPPPQDQYAVDPVSIQFTNGGVGNDWAYFGCFANSETGLTPYEAQGEFYVLADAPPSVDGRPIRITGYGVDNTPPEWSQVQQTHAGPYWNHVDTRLQYRTDTEGGNSGSGVQDDTNGLVIGIHTHGGCNKSGGANSGTAIDNAGLQAALANPQGVCRSGIQFLYPDGLPEKLPPSGGLGFVVEVAPLNGGEPQPGTGMLHFDRGGGFESVPMNEISENLYEAVFPAIPCRTIVYFYVSAQTAKGDEMTDPPTAPQDTYQAISAVALDSVFSDNFETDLGWTVQNIDLQDGAWGRGVPAGGGDRGDPPADYDGSGRCYVTDNADGDSDVDGGPTRLISPMLDLSAAPDAVVRYARWFSNDDRDQDRLDIHVSDDDGSTWFLVESVGNTSGWEVAQFRVADFAVPTDRVRVRFSATDNPNDSVTEAAIDAISVLTIECSTTVLTDFAVVKGDLLGGDLTDLTDSDDSYVHVESGFGRTFVEAHIMELAVFASTDADSPVSLDVVVETRIDEPAGTGKVALRNFNSGELDTVGQFPLGLSDDVAAILGIDATNYVDATGGIEMSLKHVVFAPFLAFTFESFIDLVEVSVD